MKSKDIKKLKELSEEVVDLMPFQLMVDGHKNFYMEGRQTSVINVLTEIAAAKKKAVELNHAIQKIENRKSSRNNTEASPNATRGCGKEIL